MVLSLGPDTVCVVEDKQPFLKVGFTCQPKIVADDSSFEALAFSIKYAILT